MRLALIVAGIISLLATPALGQYGNLRVYSDPTGCECNVYDNVFGSLVEVYVVHRDIVTGLRGVRFIVTGGGGMTMIYLSEAKIGGPLEIGGNIVDGYDVFYGSCVTGSLTIMRITYFASGTSATCSWLEVSAAPTAVTGQVEGDNCDDQVVLVDGLQTPVNPDGTCECILLDCLPVPVQQTTWGGIKALYR